MHGLVEAQSLHVRPVEDRKALSGHLPGVVQRGELHEPCSAGWLDAPQQVTQGESLPGDDHGPAFHAAKPVDTILDLVRPYEIVEGILSGLRDLAAHLNRPRVRSKRTCIPCRVFLRGAELVVVVVGGDLLVRRERIVPAGRGEAPLLPEQCAGSIAVLTTCRTAASPGPAQDAWRD